MTVLKETATGRSRPRSSTRVQPPTEVQVEDVNGDGHPDLVMDNEFFGSVSVMLNDGDGTFADRIDTTVGGSPMAVTAGDFNGDGKADLVTPNFGAVDVLEGNGDGTFAAPTSLPTGGTGTAYAATVGDFNKDGKLDIAVANYAPSDSVSILLGNGDGTFQAPLVTPIGDSPTDIRSAGNADGIPTLSSRRTPASRSRWGGVTDRAPGRWRPPPSPWPPSATSTATARPTSWPATAAGPRS